ncbi:MAG: DUF3696 domain-containing protein [Mesorhizobium sp.]|nr:MAG: DUF3696 domain-containing protein [Mesorhizobium sp.]
MLKYISLRNFRAHRDHRFDFRRINLFIGTNNSGKSSILSAINLIAQTYLASRGNSSPLVLNGPYEELGTFQDVVHGNNVRTPIGFDIGIDRYDISFDVKFRLQRRELEISRFTLHEDRQEIFSYQIRGEKSEIKLQKRPIETILGTKGIRRPHFIGFWPYHPELTSFFVNKDYPKESAAVIEKVARALRRADMKLRDSLRHFDSLSPFRAQPQRTYLYTGETPNEIGRTGSNGISLLVNDTGKRGALRIGIEDEISNWLRVNKIASQIRVKNLTTRHFEVCIVDFKGKEHNICDVGFGCSQVLPVLVGGLNLFGGSDPRRRRSPIFVVQEPEIHLHPNAQASLGSFFVGLAKSGGQQFIETHSDNLVLRVARHVALGEISPADVKIFFVEDNEGNKTITDLDVRADGVFKPDWPGGFFPQRQLESLQLAKARMNVRKSDSDLQLRFMYPD